MGKYKLGKYRLSVAGEKKLQNKPVVITDPEGNDVLAGDAEIDDSTVSTHKTWSSQKIKNETPVAGQGIITEGDNANNALEGKTYITTQAEFDAMIEAANAGTAVDAVLGAGVFRVKNAIGVIQNDIKLTGSAGTVLKRNNRIFKRTDADTEASTATHWAVALGDDGIVPFSIFLDEKDRIIPISQYSHIEHTAESYYRRDGQTITNSRNVESTENGLFYIPKGDITIDDGQLPYVFGYLDDSWTVDKFQLTGNVVTITKYGTQDTIDCFEAKMLPYAYGSSVRRFESNIGSYKSGIGLNSFVLYNVVSDDSLYYNGTHLCIPNGVSSVEVVDGWYNGIGSDFPHYADRPVYFIGNSSASQNNRRQNGKVDISGIKFVGFMRGIRISDHGTNAPLDGISIRNCRFESFTAMVVQTTLKAQKGYYTDKETSYIENCEFADCGLSGYPVVIAESNVYGSHGGSGNCIGTGKTWIVINHCTFDGFTQGINPYKRSYAAVQVRADAEVRNCVFRNFSASQLIIYDGVVTVDGNKFGNTADFLDDKERNFGNDFGLVYLDGAKKGYDFPVTISNNILVGGTTQHTTGFRSIYIDEGRNNAHIIGNVVYGVFAATAIDSRQTSDGVITFYAWKNASDTVYTTSRKSRPSYIYTHDANGFTSTGVMLEFGLATAATEITYDSKTWTYDSESDIGDIDWSSADNEYRENIVEGRMRLVYGNDVQADMLPTVTKNLQLGHYTNVLGSYAQTSNSNPYADNSVDAGDNIVTEKYRIGNGLVGVSGTVYDTLTKLIKTKVVVKNVSKIEYAETEGSYPDLTAGDIIPKALTPIPTLNKFAAQTTRGDADLKSGDALLLNIKGNLDASLNPFLADSLVSTGMNLVDPSVTLTIDGKTAYYFPVVAGSWGAYGTTQANNGYIIIGGNVNAVYYKSTKPTAESYGAACGKTTYNGNNYYTPSAMGWLTIVCNNDTVPACHLAWSNYNDTVGGTFGNTVKNISTDVQWIHTWGMAALSGNSRSVFDEIDVEGGKRYRRVDRVLLASLTWTQSTEIVDETTTYIYTASVSGMATNGLWACLYGLEVNSTALTIRSTEITTVAALQTALDGYQFYYELATIASADCSTTQANTVNDFGLSYFMLGGELVSVPAFVTEGFYQSGKDQLFNNVSYVQGEMSEVITAVLAEHEEKINGILESFRRGLPSLRVEELIIARRLDAYIKEGNALTSGAGAPTILPQFNGQEYFDTTNKVWYKASFTGTEPTAAAWKQITNA